MEITVEYVAKLKNSIFKILPLAEEKNDGLLQYIDSLIYEIYGLQYLVEKDKQDILMRIVSILEHFYDDFIQPEYDINVIRREVFHCLDLIKKSFKVGDE